MLFPRAACAAASVHAQLRAEGDVYAGVALGYHLAPDSEHLARDAVGSAVGSLDLAEGAFGWGVYGGFAVADGLCLEGGYLGVADLDFAAVKPSVDGEISTSPYCGALVAYAPGELGTDMHPFVKVGLAWWETEATFRSLSVAPEVGAAEESGVAL